VSTDKTWTGRNQWGETFFTELSASGEFAQSVQGGGLILGRFTVEGNFLCTQSEAMMMGRKYCGPIFRNPGGTPEQHDEYAFPDTASVWYFSVEK
jgi:adenylate cyclase